MTATNHTEHYELSQYTENDHPTYTGDYNSDMSKIDAAIYAASQSGGGGMATVEHTADLTGDGTTDSPLGVADTIARTEDIPSLDGYATTESVTQAIAAAIADRLRAGDIKAGNGINIETSGNTVTISYVGGGSSGGLVAVAHDGTLTGDGTSNNPLGLTPGTMSSGSTDAASCDDITSQGRYTVQRSIENSPYGAGNVTMVLEVYTLENNIIQVAKMLGGDNRVINEIWIRVFAAVDKQWGAWTRMASMADIPNVSALTSRITTLEQQVAALTAPSTPSATGLTAKQLDSQYSDGYNIVRVGTPTRSTESEEPQHE